MAGSVTGIDTGDHHLTAVQVVRGMGVWEIKACNRTPINGIEDLDQGLSNLLSVMDLEGSECIVALPDAETYYRNLAVPFKDRRKQGEILSFELEPNIPFSVDDLIIDFLSTNRGIAPELLAVFAEKRVIAQVLDAFQVRGIEPEALCARLIPFVLQLMNRSETPPSGLLLDLGEKRVTLALWQKRELALIRSYFNGNSIQGSERGDPSSTFLHAAMNTVRLSIHAFAAERKDFEPPEKVLLTGRCAMDGKVPEFVTQFFGVPTFNVNLSDDNRIRLGENLGPSWNPLLMDGALSLALGWYSAKGLGPDFRKEAFAVEKRSVFRSAMFKKVALWMLIIAALWAVDTGVDIHFLKQRVSALDDRILSIFKRTFPNIKRIVDPLKQAQIELNQLKRTATPGQVAGINGRALDLLLEISERLPESMDLKVSRLTIDSGSVRIKGDTDTYNTVDRVKQGLEKSALFKTTTISSANLDRGTNRVLFEIKLGR